MAAVEVLNYGDHRLENEYAQQTTRPWTIGWDEEDTRIRLSFLARAWVALRSARSFTKLVRGSNSKNTVSRNFAVDIFSTQWRQWRLFPLRTGIDDFRANMQNTKNQLSSDALVISGMSIYMFLLIWENVCCEVKQPQDILHESML